MWQQWLGELEQENVKALARSISLVENSAEGYEKMLEALPYNATARVIGITGPPGAGKSTLVDALIGQFIAHGKKVAVLCVDPSSPFNLGAVLGDRIRMSNWYTHPNVYIRSLATRGSMGGLNPRIIEITELVKAAGYDYVIVETVGVGQSEIEIAGLADTTVVVMVPEGGDEIQTMKAGLMEIADIFVVNKSDRPDADAFVKNLRLMLAPAFYTHREVPIIKTIGSTASGIDELYNAIEQHSKETGHSLRKSWLITERVFQLVQQHRMNNIDKEGMFNAIRSSLNDKVNFNLYRFAKNYF
jgi:LAO/AO transport system kinase